MESTPKNFALQLGSLLTLYASIGALISLLFSIITITFPDASQAPYEQTSAAESLRFSLAFLIVFYPAYIILTRNVNEIRRHAEGMYLTLTKWLLYLSLVVGGGVLLGDLVSIIYNFLNGDITIRFILKSLSLFIIVGLAVVYYSLDAKGYWEEYERRSVSYGALVSSIVCIALIVGFMKIESPSMVREKKIDQNEINDLTVIQSYILQYYEIEGSLPRTLSDISLGTLPMAPEGRSPYTYTATAENVFELCAQFKTKNDDTKVFDQYLDTPSKGAYLVNPNAWDHNAETTCFTRAIKGGVTRE